MTIRAKLLASGTNKELHSVPSQFLPDERVLVTTTGPQHHGVFRAATRTTAGTTPIVTPDALGAIVLTDLIVSTDKQAGSTLTLHFTDGVQTIDIAIFPVDAVVNLALGIVGLFRGWRDARFEMVTAGTNFDATVSVGYMKVPDGLAFASWDALR